MAEDVADPTDDGSGRLRGVDVLRKATRELKAIPQPDRDRIVERIEAFAENPRSSQHDVRMLKGSRSLRLRVGNYRVVLRPGTGGRHTVVRVAHRSEVYE